MKWLFTKFYAFVLFIFYMVEWYIKKLRFLLIHNQHNEVEEADWPNLFDVDMSEDSDSLVGTSTF